MPNQPVKPFDYQRRIFNGSGLTSGENHVAAYLAYLALTSADEYGWFTVSKSAICEAVKISKRDTVAKHLAALVAKGWADTYQPVVAGQFQAARYRLALPAARAQKTGHRAQKTGMATVPKKRAESAQNLGNEVRSTSKKVVGDGAAPRGGGADEQEQIKTAPPDPPRSQASESVDAETQPATETELLDAMQADSRNNRYGNRSETPTTRAISHGCDPTVVQSIGSLQRTRLADLLDAGYADLPTDPVGLTLFQRDGHPPALIAVLTPAQRLQLLNGIKVRPIKVPA